MNNTLKMHLISILIYIITIVLTLCWYDWKLLLIIFLFTSANNLERTALSNKQSQAKF